MLWMTGVKGPGLKGGGDRPHPARGPALKGQTVPSRAWLLKPQREGAAGPGRYLAHPTPHGRAALAAPRSREETARGRTGGRSGGRRRQGGARSALRRRHRMAARLVWETGPRPRSRTPSAHAHLNPQFAHARGVGEGAGGRDVCGGGSYGRGGPHVPKGVFPWGSLMPITGSMRGLTPGVNQVLNGAWTQGLPCLGFLSRQF